MEQPDERKNHKVVPPEVFQKKLEEQKLLGKEEPAEIRAKLRQDGLLPPKE